MSNGGFTFTIRTQFSFIVDDHTLSCILSGIAKKRINITGYVQTKLFEPHNNCHTKFNSNFVRVVVGKADSETSRDLIGVRNVLDYLGVDFQEKSIIELVQFTPGTFGVFDEVFGALWCKVTVNALYIGEETTFFVDVSDICKALKILSETPVEQCPKYCSSCYTDN